MDDDTVGETSIDMQNNIVPLPAQKRWENLIVVRFYPEISPMKGDKHII